MKLLVLGGARSGKSRYAEQRIAALGQRLGYIATAQALDAEMAERIAHHRAARGEGWRTFEAPLALPAALAQAGAACDAILVDCLTLWLSNLVLAEADIEAAGEQLCSVLRAMRVPVALVSNEVGLGIVPENALARRFRDAAGRLNQRLAGELGEVVFVAAGLPLWLKGGQPR